jgi:HIRAN domain-containing protein
LSLPVASKLRSVRNSDAEALPLRCGSGDYALSIDSQAVHQPALHRARQHVEKDRWGHLAITVQVSRDPANKYDKSVIRVLTLGGDTIGHLGRDDALEHFPFISAIENAGRIILCRAIFYGGSRERPTIGAWLDLKRPRNLRGLVRRLNA